MYICTYTYEIYIHARKKRENQGNWEKWRKREGEEQEKGEKYTYTHTNMYIYIYIYMHTCIYTFTCTYIHILMYMYIVQYIAKERERQRKEKSETVLGVQGQWVLWNIALFPWHKAIWHRADLVMTGTDNNWILPGGCALCRWKRGGGWGDGGLHEWAIACCTSIAPAFCSTLQCVAAFCCVLLRVARVVQCSADKLQHVATHCTSESSHPSHQHYFSQQRSLVTQVNCFPHI